uniref:Uncharacterized protein n=1 Tax=Panagrolaimus davidi TaxID=227884 RepID=A0A914QTQ7_9BILA
MPTSNEDVQTQINSTFLIQACVPVLTSFVPIMTALTMTFLKANIPGLGICVSLIWSWIPIANPLLTVIFIKQYRKYILNCFRKKVQNVSIGFSVTMNGSSFLLRRNKVFTSVA